jgi:hypothetical protein
VAIHAEVQPHAGYLQAVYKDFCRHRAIFEVADGLSSCLCEFCVHKE